MNPLVGRATGSQPANARLAHCKKTEPVPGAPRSCVRSHKRNAAWNTMQVHPEEQGPPRIQTTTQRPMLKATLLGPPSPMTIFEKGRGVHDVSNGGKGEEVGESEQSTWRTKPEDRFQAVPRSGLPLSGDSAGQPVSLPSNSEQRGKSGPREEV